jgi:hypothetical protein
MLFSGNRLIQETVPGRGRESWVIFFTVRTQSTLPAWPDEFELYDARGSPIACGPAHCHF